MIQNPHTTHICRRLAMLVMPILVLLLSAMPARALQQVDGVYQITCAQDLRVFAAGIKGGSIALNANAVLTQDIDMGGSANGNFPGIGPSLGSEKVYSGQFDGQGHTISNIYMSTTANRSGFFNATCNATIRNFSISGDLVVSGNHTMCGAIVGDIDPAGANTLVEDVDCNVTITCNTTGASRIGGIAGCVTRSGSSINRCRYHGTINANGVTEGIGGIAGDVRGGTIKNSLFDGTITTSAAAPKIGGIIGKRGENLYGHMAIQNCLVYGNNLPKTGANCGALIGYITSTAANTNTVSNCYYTTTNALSATGTSSATITYSPAENPWDVTGSANLNNGTLKTNLNNGQNNWKQGANYPIPGAETTYTLSFDTDGGSAVDAVCQPAGVSISKPANPTKTGYTFAGWKNSLNETVLFPLTMPAENTTLTALWDINHYDVTYYVDGVLYHTDTYDYNADITPLAAPEKERYTFSGWSDIPSTMPAENVRVDGSFAYTPTAGIYMIATKEDFFNFATIAAGQPSANAQLIADIDLNMDAFSGFTAYAGTFDGQGHTISGYVGTCTSTTTAGRGFFNSTNGATIRDLTLDGSFTISGAANTSAYIGILVGIATNTTLEDVTVAASMTTDETVNGATANTRIRIVGGLVGTLRGGSINRCRYNGTMTLNAANGQIGDRFGGLVGIQQTNASTISNCLFDGTINVLQTSIIIGGIVGQGLSGSTISNCLFAGTMTQTTGNTNCGPIIGNRNGTTVTNCFYDLEGYNFTSAYNNAGTPRATTSWNAIHQALGTGNWVAEAGKAYPVPGEQSEEHVHNYVNGFCNGMIGQCDARREEPILQDGIYKIANAGQLFFFTDNYNNGTYPADAHVLLTADIDMEGTGRSFPGIGTIDHRFAGNFDGGGHAITNFYRNISGGYSGFFNYAEDATIHNFTLDGTIIVGGTNQQIGSVMGVSTGSTTVEDVHSSVNVSITSTAAQVGGFVGRAGGTYNRCSYSGTVTSATAYNKIGGFVGSLRASNITNCLFDGQLNLSANNANLIAGGFASASIEVACSMSNCLTNGTVNIAHTTSKCGIVIGLVDRNTALSEVHYTTTNTHGMTAAIGTLSSGYILSGTTKDVTADTWDNILIMLNPTSGTEGNWQIISGKDWPQPKAGTWSHVHTYRNGFCISEDGYYQPAEKAADGYYVVDNGGKLWWIAQQLNNGTLPKNTRFKLTADIDMEGDKHGSFPGICPLGYYMQDGKNQDDWTTAFQGIFNGGGHAIHNYYRTMASGLRQGLFNSAHNATIKNFTIDGNFILEGSAVENAMVGAVIGSAHGNTSLEDITSSVNITSANARGVGGIAGALEDQGQQADVTMNRCRYNGAITLTGNTKNDGIGGLCGELRSAKIQNSLFDGTITAGSGVTYNSVGGLAGRVSTSNNSEIHRSLSHGTISLYGYTADKKSGVITGEADHTIYLNKVYHTTTKVTAGIPFIGPHTVIKSVKDEDTGVTADTELDQLLGTSHDMSANLDSLYKPGFRTILGESNWAAVEQTTGKYTYPLKDLEHIHYYQNGFCTSGDGEYERPNAMGKVYQIYNGGQLFWFATHFNNREIPQDATVEIMKDIDMEYDKYIFPGIGTSSYKFMGTFAGHERKIQRFYRDIINQEGTGLINYADNATIKEFTLYGQINYNLPTVKSFHGAVVGMATGRSTVISDIFCFVDLNATNANVRVLGGIAGRTSGKMSRCRYSGTIAHIRGEGDTIPTASGRQIGGLIANAREEIMIEDCLFDGNIWSTCQEADTMRVSGILASNEKRSGVTITIKNCLFNGCLKLLHTYLQGRDGTGVKCTENGIIAGYWDSNLPKVVHNLFYLKKCQEEMDTLKLGYFIGEKQDSTKVVVQVTEIEGEPNDSVWNEIFKELDEFEVDTITGDTTRNGNWEYVVDSTSVNPYPTPGGHVCQHMDENGQSAYDANGYCTICGKGRPLRKDEDGRYIMEYVSDLAGFRDLINSGIATATDTFNAKLTSDIDFSAFEGDFGDPIGNSHFNRYLYNFDGQGYSLLNVHITCDNEYVGFFGFAGDDTHDCIIHDFTITGVIDVPYDSKLNDDKPLYMGVVGKLFRGKIENVHSEMRMRNSNATRAKIGGILGAAEANTDDHAVLVSKCSFTGTCDANAVGSIGGIVGETDKRTQIEDCTFDGTINHTYQGDNNTTQLGGIVGHNAQEQFIGISNCVVAGVLYTDPAREFVDYGVDGNHKNVLIGADDFLNSHSVTQEYRDKFTNNYALDTHESFIPASTSVRPVFVPIEKFISGEVCAALNAVDHSLDDNYAIYGQPFGQILGYQIGAYRTAGSPAMAVPIPGWKVDSIIDGSDTLVIRPTYRVVATTNASDAAKKDYVADYYYFDDAGDTTPFPSDAATLKVKHIDYTREAEGVYDGFMSVCLPFEVTRAMLPAGDVSIADPSVAGGTRIFVYDEAEYSAGGNIQGISLKMADNQDVIPAGTPCFVAVEAEYGDDWKFDMTNPEGYPIALQPNNPSDNPATGDPGLYGAYNTELIGLGYYKLNVSGQSMVYTLQSSHCFPYRAYMKVDVYVDYPRAVAVRYVMNTPSVPTIEPTVVETGGKTIRKYLDHNILVIEVDGRRYTVSGLLIDEKGGDK